MQFQTYKRHLLSILITWLIFFSSQLAALESLGSVVIDLHLLNSYSPFKTPQQNQTDPWLPPGVLQTTKPLSHNSSDTETPPAPPTEFILLDINPKHFLAAKKKCREKQQDNDLLPPLFTEELFPGAIPFIYEQYLDLNGDQSGRFIVVSPEPEGSPDGRANTRYYSDDKSNTTYLDNPSFEHALLLESLLESQRYFLVLRDGKVSLIPVERSLDEIITIKDISPDLVIEDWSQFKPFIHSDFQSISLWNGFPEQLDPVGQLLYLMGVLMAITQDESGTIYIFQGSDGRLQTITQQEFEHILSLQFEAEIDLMINGSSIPQVAPEVYRNGYALPGSNTGTSSYSDWCDANSFSRSDGNAYYRHLARAERRKLKARIKKAAKLFSFSPYVPDAGPGIDIEEVLKHIWMAPPKKNRKKKVNGAKSSNTEKKSVSPPTNHRGATAGDPPVQPGEFSVSPATDVSQKHVQQLIRTSREKWNLILYLNGLTPSEISASATLKPQTLLVNAQGKVIAQHRLESLEQYLDNLGGPDDILPGPAPTTQEILQVLNQHHARDRIRQQRIFFHLQNFRLAALECRAPYLQNEAAEYPVSNCQRYIWQLICQSDENRKPLVQSRLFEPYLQKATALAIPEIPITTTTSASSEHLMSMILEMMIRYDLGHRWPLLSFLLNAPPDFRSRTVMTLSISPSADEKREEAYKQEEVEEEAEDEEEILQLLARETLNIRQGFIDPIELSLALTHSGLGIIASMLDLPRPTHEGMTNFESIIRFTPERSPVDLFERNRLGNPTAEDMLAFFEYRESSPHALASSYSLESEPEAWRYLVNEHLEEFPFKLDRFREQLYELAFTTEHSASPAYCSDIPLGHLYQGALMPSVNERFLFRHGITFLARALRLSLDFHNVLINTNKSVYLKVSWHRPGSEYSHLVFHTSPQIKPFTSPEYLLEQFRKLMLEWLYQRKLSEAEAQSLFHLLLRPGMNSRYPEITQALVKLMTILGSAPIGEAPKLLEILAGEIHSLELLTSHQLFPDDARSQSVQSMRVVQRLIDELTLQSLMENTHIIWPDPKAEALRPLEERVPQLVENPAIYEGLSLAKVAHFLSVFPDNEPPLLVRSGPLPQNSQITLLTLEGDETPEPFGSITKEEKNFSIDFYTTKSQWLPVTTLLNDFKNWPVNTRFTYMKNLLLAISLHLDSGESFPIQSLLMDAETREKPAIIKSSDNTGNANLLSSSSRVILEILAGEILPEAYLEGVSHTLRYLPLSTLNALPGYMRPIILFLHQSHWLPTPARTRTSPNDLMEMLVTIFEQITVQKGGQPHRSSHCVLTKSLEQEFLDCSQQAMRASGRHIPAQLAESFILFREDAYRCYFCGQDVSPHFGFSSLSFTHMLLGNSQCPKTDCLQVVLSPKHVFTLLHAQAPKLSETTWLEESVTKEEFDVLAIEVLGDNRIDWPKLSFLLDVPTRQQNALFGRKPPHLSEIAELLKSSNRLPNRNKLLTALKIMGTRVERLSLSFYLKDPNRLHDKKMLQRQLNYQVAMAASHSAQQPEREQLLEEMKSYKLPEDTPDILVLANAMGSKHLRHKVLHPFYQRTLELCQKLVPAPEGEENAEAGQIIIHCLSTLAEEYGFSDRWPLAGYLLGLDRGTLKNCHSQPNDEARLNAVLQNFFKQNKQILDLQTIGQVFGSAGLTPVVRLLQLPFLMGQSISPQVFLTTTLYSEISKRLSDLTGRFRQLPFQSLFSKTPQSLAEVTGLQEPDLMAFYLNKALGEEKALSIKATPEPEEGTSSAHPLPYGVEVQGTWVVPASPFFSRAWAIAFVQINRFLSDWQKTRTLPPDTRFRFQVSRASNHSPWVQLTLFSELNRSDSPSVSLVRDQGMGLLSLFTQNHLPQTEVLELFRSPDRILTALRSSPVDFRLLDAHRVELAHMLHSFINRDINRPDNQITPVGEIVIYPEDEALLETLSALPAPLAPAEGGQTDHSGQPVYLCQAAECEGASGNLEAMQQHTLQYHSLLPAVDITLTSSIDKEEQQTFIQAVLNAIYLKLPKGIQMGELLTLSIQLPGSPDQQPRPPMTIAVHLMPEPWEETLQMVWMTETGELKKVDVEKVGQGRILTVPSSYFTLYRLPGAASPILGEHPLWSDSSRAYYLYRLKKLMAHPKADLQFHPHRLIKLRSEDGVYFPGLVTITGEPQPGSLFNLKALACSVLTGRLCQVPAHVPPIDFAQLLRNSAIPVSIQNIIWDFIQTPIADTFEAIAGSHLVPDIHRVYPTTRPVPLHQGRYYAIPKVVLPPANNLDLANACKNCKTLHDPFFRLCSFTGREGSSLMSIGDICPDAHNLHNKCQLLSQSSFSLRCSSFDYCQPLRSDSLASAGFSYTPEKGSISCPYYCLQDIRNYMGLVEAHSVHQQLNPRCAYMRQLWLPVPLREAVTDLVSAIDQTQHQPDPILPASALYQLGLLQAEKLMSFESTIVGRYILGESSIGALAKAHKDILIEQSQEEKLCQVCWENTPDTILNPCGHMGCFTCMERLYKDKENDPCMKCKTEVKSYIRMMK